MLNKDLRDNELYEYRFGFKEQRSNNIFILLLLCALFLFMAFRTYFVASYGGVNVHGDSMNMTLKSGDKLLMRKTDGFRKAKRGDVIVVYVGDYEECKGIEGGYLIKRLIALEGDKVKCHDGQISICYAGTTDYVPLDEPYAYYSNQEIYDFQGQEYVVGEGEIFFLGDNRNNSCDSRYKEFGGSHLVGHLYKATDVYGIVPDWAIKHSETLEKLFFKS